MTISHRISTGSVAAALGGYGLAAVALLAGIRLPDSGDLAATTTAILWLLAALAIGNLHPRHWFAAWAGVAGSIVALLLIDSSLTPGLGGEWSSLDNVVLLISLAVAAVIGVIPVGLGALVPRRPFLGRRVAQVASVLGAISLLATAATYGLMVGAPANTSFAVPLERGWNTLARNAIPRETTAYGRAFTAVYESQSAPVGEDWPAAPVVGVSVLPGSRLPERCYQDGEAWPGEYTPLYDHVNAEIESAASVTLPVGQAYELVRGNPSDDSRMYAYFVPRQRQIGLVAEDLCYFVVITLPAGSGMTEADAASIIQGFRFQ